MKIVIENRSSLPDTTAIMCVVDVMRDEMAVFVNRLVAYLDNRDWRRVEDIFPNRYEREVAKKLAAGDGELIHCAMCGHWKWNADMSGQCSLQLKGRCDKFYRKDQQWR